jgi:diguanylate cyclase (GGDEF)-like protein/PAS domain S-box-containing protein
MSYPLPVNEAQRLARLHLLNVLDSGPEPIFDALTRTASAICDVPIALIGLVDTNRQWYKSSLGVGDATEVPRELSFCTHTILQTELMEVPDATQDARFKDNPFVTGEADIRFYAGAPILMPGGESIGTLCVVDNKPRQLNDLQRATLVNLAEAAAKAFDMRKKALELDQLNTSLLKKAEETNTKETLYRAIVEDQTDLISLSHPSGELTFVNEAYAGHFGLRPEQMVGHNLLDYVSERDRDLVSAHLHALYLTPGIATGENQMRSRSGEERWVTWCNRSIGDASGNVIALHSVGRDITERKRVELALKASQERFRTLYESTPAMLHSIDMQGRVLTVSDKWLQTLGYQRNEVMGRLSTDFLTTASMEQARSVGFPAFFASGHCNDIPYQMVHKDGHILDILLSAVLERDAEGQPLHALAVIQDVTQTNAIARALRVNEERLALATTVNEIGIWEYDLVADRLEWSDTMFSIFGGSRDTFSGKLDEWSSKVHPDDLQLSETQFRKAIETHAPMDFDFRVVKNGSEVRFVNARAVVIKDAQGHAARVLGTNYDITERKVVERALEQSEQSLRTIANNLPILISHIDKDYRYTFANNNYQNWYALNESPEGKTVAQVFGEQVFEQVKPRMTEAMEGTHVSFELVSQVANSPPHLLVHYLPNRDAQGNIQGVYGMVLDRTERHIAQERVAASERQLRAVTDNLPVLIYYVDRQERLGFLNATFQEWMDVELEWASGRPLAEVMGTDLYEQRRAAIQKALSGERTEFEVESVINGIRRHLQTSYIPDVWADGEVHGFFALCNEVTELKKAELELRHLVRIDSLTGLPNRRHFDDKLQKAIARNRRTGSTMALMFLDVDHFKSINDSLGHGAGDQVLCEFASRIRSALRISDTAARLAGDEFVIILEDVTATSEVETVARKVLEAVRRPMHVGDIDIVVTTSIGIAINKGEDITSEALIARADKALYRVKAAGRGAFAVKDDDVVSVLDPV